MMSEKARAHTAGLMTSTASPTESGRPHWWFAAGIGYHPRGFELSGIISDADASRVKAAWNACEGIPTEALEGGVIREMLEALEEVEIRTTVTLTNTLQAALAKARGEQA